MLSLPTGTLLASKSPLPTHEPDAHDAAKKATDVRNVSDCDSRKVTEVWQLHELSRSLCESSTQAIGPYLPHMVNCVKSPLELLEEGNFDAYIDILPEEFTALPEQALGQLSQERLDALFLKLLETPDSRDGFACLFFHLLALGCDMKRVAATDPDFWPRNKNNLLLAHWLSTAMLHPSPNYTHVMHTVVPYISWASAMNTHLWETACELGHYHVAIELVRGGIDPLQIGHYDLNFNGFSARLPSSRIYAKMLAKLTNQQVRASNNEVSPIVLENARRKAEPSRKNYYEPHLCKLFASLPFSQDNIEKIADLLSLHLKVSPPWKKRVYDIFQNIFTYEAVLPAFIRVLRREKFDLHTFHAKGNTLLHEALTRPCLSVEAVEGILSCNIDWLVKNRDGESALSILFSPNGIWKKKKTFKNTSLFCGNLLEHAVTQGANSALHKAICSYDQNNLLQFFFFLPSKYSGLLLTFLTQTLLLKNNPFICAHIVADQIERLHGNDTAKKLLARINWENEDSFKALIDAGKRLEEVGSIATRERYLQFLHEHSPAPTKRFQDELTALRKRQCRATYQKKPLHSNWPCFEQMIANIGFQETRAPLPENVVAIESLGGTMLDKYILNWSATFHHIGKISHKWLQERCKPVEFTVHSGDIFTAYQTGDFPLLAHFTTLSNAISILKNEVLAQELPFIRSMENYFWNSQEKVSASLITDQRYSFFSAHGKYYGKGVGFVIHVPDPERTLIHAFPTDTWSPSFVSDGITSVAQYNSREQVQHYITLMYRYRAIASYVYNIYLATKRLHSTRGNELYTQPLIPEFTTSTLQVTNLDELPLVKILEDIQRLCIEISMKPEAPSQQQLIRLIFNREATPEESIENALLAISTYIKNFFTIHRKEISTIEEEHANYFDPKSLLSRPLSPHELLTATPNKRCNEISVRAWPSCRAISSKGPVFKAIIIESFYFNAKRLSPQLEEILQLADKAGLPIIYLNSPSNM